MGTRDYVCNLWPKLRIGKFVKFVGGKFSTSDETLQKQIESNGAFGSAIHWQDSVEDMAARSRTSDEEAKNLKLRRQKEVLDEIAADKKASEGAAKIKADAEAEMAKVKANQKAEADRIAKEKSDKQKADEKARADARAAKEAQKPQSRVGVAHTPAPKPGETSIQEQIIEAQHAQGQ